MAGRLKYYVATWRPGSVGERMPDCYIAGPYDDPTEAKLARDRIGSDLVVFALSDLDEAPEETVCVR